MLTVSDLTKRHGDRLVLDHVSFSLQAGHRLGLVGPNGAGKSTLLSLIAGSNTPDAGAISLAPGVRVGYLRQGFADLPEGTLADLVGQVSDRLGALLDAEARVGDAAARIADGDPTDASVAIAAYEATIDDLEARGGFAATEEVTILLATLGLAGVPLSARLGTLSGGQKTRAGLAAILADRPDLLLLDEPTNHLDDNAIAWLEAFLAAYRGGVLVVSHDRAFLDRTVTGILELDDTIHRLSAYPGGYSDYAAAKRSDAAVRADAYERQQRRIAEIERDMRSVAARARRTEGATQHDFYRGRAKKVARTSKVRERKLERLIVSEERVDKPARRWGLAVDFGERTDGSRDVVVASDVYVRFGEQAVLEGVDLHVRFGDRIALIGPNGGGKSTLLKVLGGDLLPSAGRVQVGPDVVIGRYAQELETVDPARTVLEQARAVAPVSETDARSFLHRYLFGGEAVFRLGRELSYGERARLALALLDLRGATFLLLDEPLNHLDLPSREGFEQALAAFPGTALVVLHDRYAVERLANRVLELRDGRVREKG
ncbi:MAG: hypothetical protein AVDCRST_MAG19-460 [uncultured Thermomicrobiales bacterium]|uniref:ABC transporter domain-containing protein n=1 Tax=uncultured Thermomicrobiales bacterium TaxID=1645740 RepID=A0A6J4UEM7_9BACT|nr:MAG: hypothetical protein AVDCRST_MAG19-460 [uncultured Thermomicrobiales bacterium]